MGSIDDYEPGESLGGGGFAVVFRAQHIASGRRVALKKSHADDESRSRIRVEIEMQRSLHHANILRVLDFDEENYEWFVTELAEASLGQVHYATPLAATEVLRVAEEILSALGVAHRRKVLHRDLSLENILRLRDAWMLADWGYLKAPDATGLRRLTRTGTGGGTATWAAPEMLADAHHVDLRADLYALGKILAWLLAGGPPPGIGVAPSIEANTEWSAFLERMTARDVDERPSSAEEALSMLGEVAARLPPSLDPPGVAAPGFTAAFAQVETLKRYLTSPQDRIRLHDLLVRETDRACATLAGSHFDTTVHLDGEQLRDRLRAYAEACSPLVHLVFVGCLHGEEGQVSHWTKCVERVAARDPATGTNSRRMLDLQKLAPLVLMYAGALGAVIGNRAYNLAAVTVGPMLVVNDDRAPLPIVDRVSIASALPTELFRNPAPENASVTPGSDWLFEQLRDAARAGVVNSSEYETAFDELELVMALMHLSRRRPWADGRYWLKDRWRSRDDENSLVTKMNREFTAKNARWKPFVQTIFESEEQRAAAFATLTKRASEHGYGS